MDYKAVSNDTICATATALGGAIAVIRVSGSEAIAIACSVCRGIDNTMPANSVRFARIYDGDEVVDEVMVSIFRAPHSYTGEDSIELSCHGSRYVVSQILDLLIKHGCRMAGPGEYTMRAYLNGKLDLTQAEAVADLIASTNKATHNLAISQLRGHFSSELSHLREQLLKLTSMLELELDFSDHEELEFADRSELKSLSQEIDNHISRLAHSFHTGRALKEGIPVAIVGKTNVGKSTLLNSLLKEERAIVSDIHGTTRDTIEDTIDLHGITFRFIDTAGIRNTKDEVEKIGIMRTFETISKARIVLWIIDEAPTKAEQDEMAKRCEEKALIIVSNKSDKGVSIAPTTLSIPHQSLLQISAKTGANIPQLETAIYHAANLPEINANDVIITSARHYDALTKAHKSLQRVLDGMDMELSGDLLAEDLRQALSHLADITGGAITTHEVLGNIFKHFCVGK